MPPQIKPRSSCFFSLWWRGQASERECLICVSEQLEAWKMGLLDSLRWAKANLELQIHKILILCVIKALDLCRYLHRDWQQIKCSFWKTLSHHFFIKTICIKGRKLAGLAAFSSITHSIRQLDLQFVVISPVLMADWGRSKVELLCQNKFHMSLWHFIWRQKISSSSASSEKVPPSQRWLFIVDYWNNKSTNLGVTYWLWLSLPHLREQ